ncbi:methyl-accepting chemotaxis protein [Hyalangium rubrum]|uniref:Methyl-accepting chemotaxis protein n=1 Tax=Hyalangium rubrum TaxID=3103134 RepID=A0ABU5HDH2_9BACT|nr:methyl-accepting chemotaxis protein [Hyalangium sp. s54d21]MDY7231518.1 methyl-accepting chemotaxis protein [Hyalangium sp. s54d21]
MRLSLSMKLSLGPLSVAVLTGLLAFGYFLPRVESAFAEQGRELGAELPATLASSLTELIAAHQVAAVQTAIDEIASRPRVAYIAVTNPDGELIAASGVLRDTVREKHRELLRNQESHTHQHKGDEILDMRAPVRQGTLGHIHVGFNRSAARARIQVLIVRFSLVLAAALAAFSLGGFLLSRRIVAPLLRLTAAARRIAQGDLRETIEVDSRDEVGELSQAFASMVGRLKAVLMQLQTSSELMARSVRVLNQSALDQNQMATRYASALQETQATAQELHQTSLAASESAETVLKVAARADELGRTGEAAITESINGLVELRNQVKEIETQINALGEHTRQIGGITQTVKDLADQSHMLALNAAIEAVRSGEHGKGFGVVAREIRALADKSIRATSQVRELLTDVSNAIATTVRITEEGAHRMEAGLSQVRQSGDNLRALSSIVRDSSSSVRQIAQTVNQQTAGVEQIFSAVVELNSLMEDTLQRITATSNSVGSLQSLSDRVSRVVSDYQL